MLNAAIEIADQGGIEALTMRSIGQRLGAEAMSLYRHVESKDDVLDGIVDKVYEEIDLPTPGRRGATACGGGRSRPGGHSIGIRGRAR